MSLGRTQASVSTASFYPIQGSAVKACRFHSDLLSLTFVNVFELFIIIAPSLLSHFCACSPATEERTWRSLRASLPLEPRCPGDTVARVC